VKQKLDVVVLNFMKLCEQLLCRRCFKPPISLTHLNLRYCYFSNDFFISIFNEPAATPLPRCSPLSQNSTPYLLSYNLSKRIDEFILITNYTILSNGLEIG